MYFDSHLVLEALAKMHLFTEEKYPQVLLNMLEFELR